jgi:hypothetical protein
MHSPPPDVSVTCESASTNLSSEHLVRTSWICPGAWGHNSATDLEPKENNTAQLTRGRTEKTDFFLMLSNVSKEHFHILHFQVIRAHDNKRYEGCGARFASRGTMPGRRNLRRSSEGFLAEAFTCFFFLLNTLSFITPVSSASRPVHLQAMLVKSSGVISFFRAFDTDLMPPVYCGEERRRRERKKKNLDFVFVVLWGSWYFILAVYNSQCAFPEIYPWLVNQPPGRIWISA